MTSAIISSGIIMSIFWIIWMVKFPDIVLEVALFRDADSIEYIVMGLITWLFFFGFIVTMTFIGYLLASAS